MTWRSGIIASDDRCAVSAFVAASVGGIRPLTSVELSVAWLVAWSSVDPRMGGCVPVVSRAMR